MRGGTRYDFTAGGKTAQQRCEGSEDTECPSGQDGKAEGTSAAERAGTAHPVGDLDRKSVV